MDQFFVISWKCLLKKSGAAWWTLKWSRGGFLFRNFNKGGAKKRHHFFSGAMLFSIFFGTKI